MAVPKPLRRPRVMAGALASAMLLVLTQITAACTVNPPPAPQSTETPKSTAPPPKRVSQIIMGIDSIGAGFNPHLRSDLSAVTAAISALVLP
ncbi:MAG: ABC transporter family substrate-binding protein, partial [Actinomycetota bacterium]|nr:ABC transporter family substrate-binding protein [Actinomycetota bacterium]